MIFLYKICDKQKEFVIKKDLSEYVVLLSICSMRNRCCVCETSLCGF